jgi:methylated-DNA-[protein]-cysteine S-methyltransferase
MVIPSQRSFLRKGHGMQPVFYDKIATTLGPIYIAVRERKLVAIQVGGSAADFLRSLRRQAQAEPVRKTAAVRAAAGQIREYLAGRRRAFRLEPDWRGVTPFRARVLRAAMRIPYGKTRTYGEIARSIGAPRAARAVGQALGANPFAPVVPCHRVVAGDGSLGGYSASGGVKIKRRLLRLEGRI